VEGEGAAGVGFKSDGSQLVSASGDRIQVWDVAAGEVIHVLEGHQDRVMRILVTPDDARIVSSSADQTIRIWDMAKGELLHTLQGHTGTVDGLALDPERRRIYSMGFDRRGFTWDLRTGEKISTWPQLDAGVFAVAISPDGTRLATGGSDGLLHLWDPLTMQRLHSYDSHLAPIHAVAFSADGSQLISGSMDRTLRFWSASPQPLGDGAAAYGAVTQVDDERVSTAPMVLKNNLYRGSGVRDFFTPPDSILALLRSTDRFVALDRALLARYYEVGNPNSARVVAQRLLRQGDAEARIRVASMAGDLCRYITQVGLVDTAQICALSAAD